MSSSWQLNVRSVSHTLSGAWYYTSLCGGLPVYSWFSCFSLSFIVGMSYSQEITTAGSPCLSGRLLRVFPLPDPHLALGPATWAAVLPYWKWRQRPKRCYLMAPLNDMSQEYSTRDVTIKVKISDGRLMDWINFPGIVHQMLRGWKASLNYWQFPTRPRSLK